MEVICNNYMPGDPRLVEQLVSELKSQGIFDLFRKECISDVDTKPAYQNLRQRVEGTVTTFLKQQTWSVDLNKNQLREQLRKNLHESGFLETGVERIVDQVVNPKISTVFLPKVEEIVYRFLGVEKPAARIVKKEEKKVSITDLLPTDLEAVSPESVESFKNEKKNDSLNDSQQSSEKMDEDESPPFEPLGIHNNHENSASFDEIKMQIKENSRDSHLSGFSGLQSHDSQHENEMKNYQMELFNQDSQNSSETRLSIVTSEETTKMEICEGSNMELKIDKLETQSTEINETINNENAFGFKDVKKEEYSNDKQEEKSDDRKSRSLEKSKDRKDDKYRKSSSSKDKEKSSKYSSHRDSKDKDSNKKDSKSSSSHRDKGKERSDKEKEKSSKYKEKSEKDKSKPREDKKGEKSKSNKDIANKSEKEKIKSDKSKSDKEKSNRDKDKYKSNKDKHLKEKEKDKYKDRLSKSKEKSDKDKEKMSKDKVYKEKDNTKEKNKESTDKDKIKSTSGSSKHSSGKDKNKDSSSHSSKDKSKPSKEKDKKDETKHSTSKKESRDPKKKSKDDHYSSKIKKTDRRSTDRDSNDGTSSKNNYLSTYSESMSSKSENNSQDYSNSSFSGGSGDSGNSDQTEKGNQEISVSNTENDNMEVKFVVTEIQPMKYNKPKFALNFEEARKIMKIRKQLAKLERQNQLSLTRIDLPKENGIKEEFTPCENISKTEIVENVSPNEVKENYVALNDSGNVESDNLNEIPFESTDLSMENFEALEAKLAQVMSTINYNSYESDEDYEFHGYSSTEVIDVVPKDVIELNRAKLTEMQLLNNKLINENIQSNCEENNSTNIIETHDECRYLEKASFAEEKNLKFLHLVIMRLEREVNECIETTRNNFWPVKKGRKRKLEECVDLKNNNTEYMETVKKRRVSASSNTVTSKANRKNVSPNEQFSLPLSPAESDKSNERKEEDLLIPMKQKRIMRGYSQRYSSDELYKPRPIIGRRNRYPKNAV